MSIELIVAHYAEDLAWLRNIPPQIRATVYDKNPAHPHPGAICLPNVGREAHTYLHHICARYDDLAPLSVFCQGKPFDHCFDFRKILRELVGNPAQVEGFRWLGHVIDTDSSDGALFKVWSKNPDGGDLDIAAFHRALFGFEGPPEYVFRLAAQFAITRERVRSRPLSFYQHALQLAMDVPDAAHCYERLWDRVFGVTGVELRALEGQRTRYFKPVRRLDSASLSAALNSPRT